MKFLKLIITHYTNESNKASIIIDINKTEFEANFSNLNKCRNFLYTNYISNFLSGNQQNELPKQFRDNKLIDFYKDFFLNSKYLLEFIYPKIIKDHENLYHMHFVEYLHKIY